MIPALDPFAARLARIAAVGVGLGYGALLMLYGLSGKWILDGRGAPLITDFLPVHVTGQLTRAGAAASAYDPDALHRAQSAFVGHDFSGFLGWHYPPLFLLIAAALALLPYAAAFLAWVVATVAAFAALLTRIAGPKAAWTGLALPAALASAMVGQNGFFTAALFAGFLLALPSAPLSAGVLAALISYKPQFGLLIPVALIAGGHWRAFLAASVGVAVWLAICAAVAPAALMAFLHYLPQTSQAILGAGSAGWFKLASVYGLVRSLGGGNPAAWLAQGLMTGAVALLVALAWWRTSDFAPKAALLASASLAATPYVYFYDLPLLAVALAFLWRQREFDGVEQVLFAACIACQLLYALGGWPLGVFATLLVLAMAVRRSFLSGHQRKMRLSMPARA